MTAAAGDLLAVAVSGDVVMCGTGFCLYGEIHGADRVFLDGSGHVVRGLLSSFEEIEIWGANHLLSNGTDPE